MQRKKWQASPAKATPAIIRRAKEEPVKYKSKWKCAPRETECYQNGAYASAKLTDGILRVAVFMTEELRKGNTTAHFELYMDMENDRFITYNRKAARWQESMIFNLDWPDSVWLSKRRVFFMPQARKLISQTLLKGLYCDNDGAYKGLQQFQERIRQETREEGYRRETEPWDRDMERIPPLPKGFETWAAKQVIDQHYLLYRYDPKGVKEGYCTFCGKNVPADSPKYGKSVRCRRCHKMVTCKSTGKAGSFYTDTKNGYLIQRCRGGFCIRMFQVWTRYRKGSYENAETCVKEVRRVLYSADKEKTVYYWDRYKDGSCRFVKGRWYSESGWWMKGLVYKENLKGLEKDFLKKSGLPAIARAGKRTDPEDYLKEEERRPILERMAKAGLYELALEYAQDGSRIAGECGTGLDKALGIDKHRMGRLREMDGGKAALSWLRYEKQKNTEFPREMIQFFASGGILPAEIARMLHYMTEIQAYHYLAKQAGITGAGIRKLAGTWEDYMDMAKRLKMDLSRPLVHKPKNLKNEHDSLVKLVKERGLELQADEIRERFGEAEARQKEIKEKFEYRDKKYAVIVPTSVEEILKESSALRLCIDRTDIYWDRIEQRETFLVWLRRVEEIDKPWYVLEVQPGGAVRQKRTLGDNQNDDFKEAVNFITKWQKAVQGRMTEEDRRLGETSDRKREKEFAELRKNGNRIHRGKLEGELLAEVLERDFMEIGGKEYVE
ncbi:MAG: PcfJ domain-containing protein [Bacteroidales bacterium]|nr:PcfJ domain-containing protein [Clostridium sp.]MCM1204725.1 PcfJ domain-containing protein [Bacteroidales bacterium]